MKIIDMTHVISPDMPMYPGTEGPKISQATTIASEGFAEKLISMYSHTGTHIDAPAHILAGAKNLDDFDASWFVGPAAVIDVSKCKDGIIAADLIEARIPELRGKSFVLFYSGWSALWGKASYFEGFPILSEEAAHLVCTLNLHGIGIDMMSVDRIGSVDFPVHNILFKSNLVIVENLTGMASLKPEGLIFSCLPLKMPASDGSPVRAVALEP